MLTHTHTHTHTNTQTNKQTNNCKLGQVEGPQATADRTTNPHGFFYCAMEKTMGGMTATMRMDF